MREIPTAAEGVLPNQWLHEAIASGVITGGGFEIPPENVQPASVDLRLGEWAFSLRCSFLPTGRTVESRVKDFQIDKLNLHSEGVVLEPGRPYLIPLKEQLALPPHVRARANPKSSTGRADVFTRVITDYGGRFDEIAAGYKGRLYLEVVPLSFPVRVREDLTLNQLRLSVGRAELTDQEVREWHLREPLLYAEGTPVPAEGLDLARGLLLGLDLRGDPAGNVGYQARSHAPLLDMTKTGQEVERFWEAVRHEQGNQVVLAPRLFYLLMSYEAVCIPPALAAEMTAYDPTNGELRTHYAGFFDPGFGYDPVGELHGTTAALEVRAHDVPFLVEHQQRVCKLTFEKMLEEPTMLYGRTIGSNYQGQTETLGKHFRLPRLAPQQTPSSPPERRATKDPNQSEFELEQ